jgi:hypothetical protein
MLLTPGQNSIKLQKLYDDDLDEAIKPPADAAVLHFKAVTIRVGRKVETIGVGDHVEINMRETDIYGRPYTYVGIVTDLFQDVYVGCRADQKPVSTSMRDAAS